MIISCEHCAKRYLLDEAALGTSERILRCAACGHSWTHTPVSGHETLVASMASLSGAQTAETDFSPTRRGYASLSLLFALFLSFALLGGYFARGPIATVWPGTLPLFHFLGLNVQPSSHGLIIRGAHPLQTTQQGAPDQAILIGEIVNTSDKATPLPPLKVKGYGACENATVYERARAQVVSLFTKQDPACVLVSWTHPLTESRLLPEERLSFQTQPHPLPPGVVRLVLEF